LGIADLSANGKLADFKKAAVQFTDKDFRSLAEVEIDEKKKNYYIQSK